ncbi:hypothetical protein DERF_014060 [Dermatophagoides farinae]|uniref:Tubby-like protein n=1 Tax=Dermatophagoides farinae TaxID=6954 RepID=A0A922KTK4_DERFA|nr:hypothetical protein DERF_014060 [Dermatophagoides farinae]
METSATTTTGNRLSSAKWSRNLNQDCQSEANRLRLLERQRQLIETKLQRRQLNQQNENIIIPSSPSSLLQINSSTTSTTTTTTTAITTRTIRPATSIGNLRSGIGITGDYVGGSRAIQPPPPPPRLSTDSSDSSSIFQRNNSDDDDDDDGDRDSTIMMKNRHLMMKNRARTSVPGSRPILTSMDSNNHFQQQQQQKLSTKFNQEQKNGKFLSNSNTKSSQRSNMLMMSKSEVNLQQLMTTTMDANVEQKLSMPNPLQTVLTDEELLKFVSQPISPDVTLQCTIIRDKKGLDRSLYPTYYMHLQEIVFNNNNKSVGGQLDKNNHQRNNQQQQQGTATVWMSDSMESINSTNEDSATTDDEQQQQQQQQQSINIANNNSSSTSTKKVFILSGRRRKKSKTYLIGNNAFDISRDRCIAKLKSNVLGTQFTAIRLHSNGVRYEISSITYETNVLGFKGPRKMTIIIPKPDEKTNALCNLSLQEELKRNSRAIMLLKNKTPIWNEETQSYVLNFHGRVTQASVKNFQLVVQNFNLVNNNNNNDGNNRKSNNNTAGDNQSTTTTATILRRSASSHQLRHNNDFNNDDDDDDDSDDDDDDDGSDDDSIDNSNEYVDENGENKTKSSSTISSSLRKNHPLSKSGYLMATSSEDAKQIADHSNDLVSLQFGRVSNTHFSCDVSWPLSLLQAFAIALSSFDSKLACE